MALWRVWSTGVVAVSVLLALSACTPVDPPPATVPADVACRVERDTLETAIEAWRADPGAGVYPDSLEQVRIYLDTAFPLDKWTYEGTGTGYVLTGAC